MVDGDRLHELLGAEAAPALEQLLAVRRAEPQVLGQALQRGLLHPCLGEEGDGAADQVVVARPVRAQGCFAVSVAMWVCSMVNLAVVSGGGPRSRRVAMPNRPDSCASPSNACAAARLQQGSPQLAGQAAPLVVVQEAAEHQLPAALDEPQVGAAIRPLPQAHARPIGLQSNCSVRRTGARASAGSARASARWSRTGAPRGSSA